MPPERVIETDVPVVGGGMAGFFAAIKAREQGASVVLVCIGYVSTMGYVNGAWQDVHGAGAQRSDPKTGNPADYPNGRGPQGDAIRINNYVRLVRGGNATAIIPTGSIPPTPAMGTPPTTGQRPPAGRPPPQEATDACEEAGEGKTCQVTTPQGTLTGTCRLIQGQRACVPERGPP